MIRRIGVICQDRNSYGFLEGVKRRLGCDAVLIEPATGALGKSTTMTRKQARLAAADLTKKNVDLIVRLTDADQSRWQTIRQHELDAFPEELKSLIVCGVAVENTEHWLSLNFGYLSDALSVPNLAKLPGKQRTGVVKNAIARHRESDKPAWDVTAQIVADAPTAVFRSWLAIDDSLRSFYEDCRAAALQVGCQVTNEL